MFDGWYSANRLAAAMFLARAENVTMDRGSIGNRNYRAMERRSWELRDFKSRIRFDRAYVRRMTALAVGG